MYLTTNHANGTGRQCAANGCDRIARFQIHFPSAHETKHFCSSCLAKIVETVFLLRDTVKRLDSQNDIAVNRS
jgi:hypothetical protein